VYINALERDFDLYLCFFFLLFSYLVLVFLSFVKNIGFLLKLFEVQGKGTVRLTSLYCYGGILAHGGFFLRSGIHLASSWPLPRN
jgi:hypothetical protein